ncbi:hypothetical protein VPHK479_0091 [Vibrio phage K479]
MIITTDSNNDPVYITDPLAIEWVDANPRLGEAKLYFANSVLVMKLKVFEADVLPYFSEGHSYHGTN